jgi:hypothetical protein
MPKYDFLHQGYTFYVKVTALGGSYDFFGPYVLNVGCFDPIVTYSDHASFVSTLALAVGDSSIGVYTLMQPSSTRSWCIISQNTIVNPDQSAWSGAAKLVP